MNALLHLSILPQKLLHSSPINKSRLNVDHLTDSFECCMRQMEHHHWLDTGFQTVTSVKRIIGFYLCHAGRKTRNTIFTTTMCLLTPEPGGNPGRLSTLHAVPLFPSLQAKLPNAEPFAKYLLNESIRQSINLPKE